MAELHPSMPSCFVVKFFWLDEEDGRGRIQEHDAVRIRGS